MIGYWLKLGVSGFRIDSVPFLIDLTGLPDPDVEDPHVYLKELREYVNRRRGDAVLLGEANIDIDRCAASSAIAAVTR